MSDAESLLDFDVQAAWLRRFGTDAENNLRAFAQLLKEALPERVTVHESRGLLARHGRIRAVSVQMGDSHYHLKLVGGTPETSIAMVVRGVTLNTRSVDPGTWFSRLFEDLHKATDQARQLSQSIGGFLTR